MVHAFSHVFLTKADKENHHQELEGVSVSGQVATTPPSARAHLHLASTKRFSLTTLFYGVDGGGRRPVCNDNILPH